MNAIEIKNLKKYYGNTKAVDGISFEVKKGEIFGFLGPNGAGKSTTIRTMMDFLRPTSGNIVIAGKDSHKDSVELKEKIGYLSGNVSLYEKWTGLEHIEFIESIQGKSKILDKLYKELDFNPKIKTKNYSSGNKQKLGLILALMNEPEILIMDEPTIGLDPLLQNTIYKILKEFSAKGTTIFFSSHNLPEVEKVCGRVGIIKNGKIIAIESIKNLKAKKIYTVKVDFDEDFDKKKITSKDVEILDEINHTLILRVKRDINSLLKALNKYKIKDIEIIHSSLEDIFLEFYKNKK